MVLKTYGNLKQLWEHLKHLWRVLALLRRFSVAFRGLWNFQNGPRGLWQIKTVMERFKTLLEDSGTF